MKPFSIVEGVVLPIDRSNVDTDAIIPKQFLKSVKKTGFGDNLFDEWRYLDEGNPGVDNSQRKVNKEFVLNQPRYRDAVILLGRENFGCGSSREHAVWAIAEFGIRVVIAPSFADIFYSNCFKNGVLPIQLDGEVVSDLFSEVFSADSYSLCIDLVNQQIRKTDKSTIKFETDSFRRACLLNGDDDIDLTLKYKSEIQNYEDKRKIKKFWLYG